MAASSGDAHSTPIYGARLRVVFPILDADGDLQTGAAGLDSELSQDQGTFADATNEATEIATSSGMYYLDLISTEMDVKSVAIIVKTSTVGAKTTPMVIYPKRLTVLRTGTAQAGAGSTITLDSGASAIDNFYLGCYVNCTNNSPANAIGQARRITGYVGSTKVATVEAAWGTNPSSATTFEILMPEMSGVAMWAGSAVADPHTAGYPVATVKDGTGTGEIDTTSGGVLVAAIAANAITATSIATDAITAAKIAADAIGASELAADAVTEIQAGLATSAALATVQADTDDIQTRLPAALVSGRIDASVGAMASGVVTATSIATDAITAAKIAPDAIGASELAADAVTEIQAGLATSAALATVQADTDDIQSRLPAALVSGRMDASVGAMAASVITATSIATDAITAAKIAADAIGAAELAADAVAEIADAVWDEVLSGHLTAGTTGAALNAAGSAGDPWTTALPGSYGAGTAGKIVGDNVNTTISSRSSATSLATAQTDLDDIQTRLPAALVSGRMDSDVAVIQTAVITANAIAPDAIGASELAASAVTEIADGILDRDMSIGADTGSEIIRTVRQALRALRNRFSISSTTRTVYKEDDMTPAWTSTLQTDAAAEPIVGDDPTGP